LSLGGIWKRSKWIWVLQKFIGDIFRSFENSTWNVIL